MDFKFLADTVRNLILNTVKEWDIIYTENKPARLFSRSLFLPLLLCQILSQLFESFIFVNILAFFGFYILYTGIERMLSPTDSDRIKMMIAVPMVFFILFILTGRIVSQITDKFYFSIFS